MKTTFISRYRLVLFWVPRRRAGHQHGHSSFEIIFFARQEEEHVTGLQFMISAALSERTVAFDDIGELFTDCIKRIAFLGVASI